MNRTIRIQSAVVIGMALFFLGTAAHAEDGAKRLLLVETQSPDTVPSLVAKRVHSYLKTVLEMETGVALIVPETLAQSKPAGSTRRAQVSDPTLARADEALQDGKAKVAKRRYMQAVKSFKKAVVLYGKRLESLEDFDKYVDANLSRALAYFKAGYDDNGEDDLAKVLVMRPELVLDKRTTPRPAIQSLARLRALYGKAATASVSVTSDPPGATVYLDGILSGQTPIELRGLLRGQHVVRVVHPNHESWARTVTSSSRQVKLKARLKALRGKRAVNVYDAVTPEGLQAAAKKGSFTPRFVDAAQSVALKYALDGIVMSYLRKTPREYEVAVFFFDREANQLAELPWARIDHDLTSLQVAVLELSSGIGKAARTFPAGLAMSGRSNIHEAPPAGEGVDHVGAARVDPFAGLERRARSDDEDARASPGTTGDRTEPSDGAAADPVVADDADPTPATQPGDASTLMDRSGPQHLSQVTHGRDAPGDPGADTELRRDDALPSTEGESWYEKWWVWAIVGGVAAGATATYFLVQSDSGGAAPGYRATVSW